MSSSISLNFLKNTCTGISVKVLVESELKFGCYSSNHLLFFCTESLISLELGKYTRDIH